MKKCSVELNVPRYIVDLDKFLEYCELRDIEVNDTGLTYIIMDEDTFSIYVNQIERDNNLYAGEIYELRVWFGDFDDCDYNDISDIDQSNSTDIIVDMALNGVLKLKGSV